MAGALLRPMSRRASKKGELYESVLARNLRALIAHQAEGSTNGWCLRHGLPQSTLNKVRNGMQGTTTTVLQQVEDATGYAAWQLLHPQFDPAAMPPMNNPRAMRVAAIFVGLEKRDRDTIEALAENFAVRTTDPDAASPSDEAAPIARPGRDQ